MTPETRYINSSVIEMSVRLLAAMRVDEGRLDERALIDPTSLPATDAAVSALLSGRRNATQASSCF